ncbi:hypothetical protein [Hymenobacter cellulosilyticus]|uniref:Uncharacterized protein n=1 Tax=Hymenobacter cellulosilyticus TaxID=2932248 RepID=A0A8T9QH47_9BACT|nr:hypothetical protein [Hymenobacter cellulosilyticus]UOQ75170.1 hypothetical protein MUN79_28695 [Hymenobacter cellulosilyticus]
MDPTAIDLNMAVYEQKLEAIYTEMLTFTSLFINLGRAVGALVPCCTSAARFGATSLGLSLSIYFPCSDPLLSA